MRGSCPLLARTLSWVLILIWASSQGMRAKTLLPPSLDVCQEATPIGLDSTVRFVEAAGASLRRYSISTPSAGVLTLDTSAPGSGTDPGLRLPDGSRCDDRGLEARVTIAHRTPTSLIVLVEKAMTILVEVSVPASSVGNLKLRSRFVPRRDYPDDEIRPPVDPPDACSNAGTPLATTGLVETRYIRLHEHTDPIDCDVWVPDFGAPGVVLIHSTDAALRASLFERDSSGPQSRFADRVLRPTATPLIAPVTQGQVRLVIEALEGRHQPYSVNFEYFNTCSPGENAADDHGNSMLCSTPLDLGEVTDGEIGNLHGDDADHFTFFLSEQESVTIEVAGAAARLARLWDARGLRLTSACASSCETHGSLSRTLGPGRYYLRVDSKDRAEGPYSVVVKLAEPLSP